MNLQSIQPASGSLLPGVPMGPAWQAQDLGKDHPVPKPKKKPAKKKAPAKKAPAKKKKK